jgi:hypothetical protein
MGALETYLSSIRDTKVSGEGVSELSYYLALHALLEEVGAGRKPKVRCFMNLKNRGAGSPGCGCFLILKMSRLAAWRQANPGRLRSVCTPQNVADPLAC